MTAVYTFDIFSTLDGFASYDGGDWGGYWGKQGPEFLDRRLALYGEQQRMVFGANTFRQMVELLGSAADFDLELIESRTLDGHTQELVYRPIRRG